MGFTRDEEYDLRTPAEPLDVKLAVKENVEVTKR
jgi:hypothetical protein